MQAPEGKSEILPRGDICCRKNSARAGWTIAGLAGIAAVAAILFQVPAVRTDAAFGLLAAMQHEVGRSPSILSLSEADPDDLAHDRTRRVSEWAPAYQAVPYGFHRLGLDWPNAVRLTVLSAWGLGLLGWGSYFRVVLGPGPAVSWLFAFFLLFRYSHNQAYAYNGGEALEWGAFPLVVLVNLWAMTDGRPRIRLLAAALGGAAAAGLFLIRYGAVLNAAGLGVAWFVRCFLRQCPWRRGFAWGMGASLTGAAIVLAGFPGGRNAVTMTADLPHWAFIWPWLTWTLALTDVDGLVRWLLLHPAGPFFADEAPLLVLGAAVLGLIIAVRMTGRDSMESPRAVTVGVLSGLANYVAWFCLITSMTLFSLLYVQHRSVSLEGRHLRLAALLVLPFVFKWTITAMRQRDPLPRRVGLLALATLFLLPAVYGATSLVTKAVFRQRDSAGLIGPQGLRLDLLGPEVNARAFYDEVEAAVRGSGAVLYLPHPEEAFALVAHRLLVVHVDILPPDVLRSLKYRGSPMGGVVLLLPRVFDANGKSQLIKTSFGDIRRWQQIPLQSAPTWSLWWGTDDGVPYRSVSEAERRAASVNVLHVIPSISRVHRGPSTAVEKMTRTLGFWRP